LHHPAEYYVKRQPLSRPKDVRVLPATKSLRDRYAEVLRLRRAICQTKAALQAPATVNRLAAK